MDFKKLDLKTIIKTLGMIVSISGLIITLAKDIVDFLSKYNTTVDSAKN